MRLRKNEEAPPAVSSGWGARVFLSLTLVLAVVVPRLLWHRFLDSFEDGYQIWWTASLLVETGEFGLLFTDVLQGNWLPGFYLVAAGVIRSAGTEAFANLKLLNVIFALGTTGAIYLIAMPRGIAVALLAAVLFALNPLDIVISSYATPEAMTLFLVFAGVALIERRPFGPRSSVLLASVAFLVAFTLRYEAWAFILVYLLWTGLRRGASPRTVTAVILPSLVFVVVWVLWISQFGFLPQTILTQTSTDVSYKESLGVLAPLGDRLLGFHLWYLSWTPFVVLAFAWALAGARRSAFSAILLVFYAAISAFIVLNLGNPSARYIHLTIPVVSIYAASSLIWLGRKLHRAPVMIRSAAGATPVLAAVFVSLLLTIMVLNPSPLPGTFMRPMERAGIYVSNLSHPEGKMLVTESPLVAYLSGYPASEIIWSAELPDDRDEAEAFLVEHVAYVVMVTVPYYRLRSLFPEQADGVNTEHLILLYDASGPEYDIGAHRVLVFEVVS